MQETTDTTDQTLFSLEFDVLPQIETGRVALLEALALLHHPFVGSDVTMRGVVTERIVRAADGLEAARGNVEGVHQRLAAEGGEAR